MFKPLIDWYLATLGSGGYPLIALLMAIESSIVPLPSEVVIPPAAHLAYSGQISLSMVGIVIAGTVGSWIGASVMYWASRLGGRPLVMRYGRYVFISPEKVEGAERWAAHYGSMGIFISRLLPVVRHLVGIPAGIVRMNFTKYSIYTLLGQRFGAAGSYWQNGAGRKLMQGELHRITLWLVGIMVGLGGIYYLFVHRPMKNGKRPETNPS
jgi:membrane protein DedA with SNARE-associated domain